MEETVQAVKHVPQERIQSNTVEQIAAVPVPRIREETGQVTQRIPQDRTSDCNSLQIQEKLVEVIRFILQEPISEHIEAKLASRIQEELLEVIQLIQKARISDRIVETFMDVAVPQIQERLVEGNKLSKYTNAVRTEETSQRQSLEENTLHPSSEQCTRSSADTWVRQAFSSEAHVGSCSVSNVARSLTGECAVSRPLVDDTMHSTLSSPKQVPGKIADTPVVAQHQVPTAQNVCADKAVIKKNHVKKCLDMFAEIAGKKDDQKKFSEEFGKGRKREINTSKFGKEQGNEVLHVVDVADELAVQQPKKIDGRRLKSARKDGFDLGDGDDELKVESGMVDCCVVVTFKFETGHREEMHEAVQDTWNQLDKKTLAENDVFDLQQKNWEGADMMVDMPGAAEHRHEVMQRQVPNIQSTQKTVEVPRVQFIDRVVDDPAVMQREAFNI